MQGVVTDPTGDVHLHDALIKCSLPFVPVTDVMLRGRVLISMT